MENPLKHSFELQHVPEEKPDWDKVFQDYLLKIEKEAPELAELLREMMPEERKNLDLALNSRGEGWGSLKVDKEAEQELLESLRAWRSSPQEVRREADKKFLDSLEKFLA